MPTLRALRRATADRVAPYELVTAGVEDPATPGAYAGTALGANRRRIVTTDLVSISAAGIAPEAPEDYLKGEWCYLLTTPPQQRRVPEGGFNGYDRADILAVGYGPAAVDTPVAAIDLDRPLAAVVAAGTAVEIHAIPPLRAGRSSGIHAHINKALRVMLREDTLAIPGATGQYRIDVTASFPWLTRPEQMISAHEVETVAGVDTYAIPGAYLRFDANTVYLLPNATFTTGQTIPVRVLRPLSSWIKVEGVWGESAVGLISEDDECLGDLDAISLVAAFHVAEEQARQCIVGSPEQVFWLAQAGTIAARSPFLRDQVARRPASGASMPDNISPLGPYGGRWGPGWR